MKKRNTRFNIIVYILISLSIVLLSKFPPFTTISSIIQKTISPIKAVLYREKLAIFVGSKTEIETLKEENKKLLEKLSDFERIKKDNQAYLSQFQNSPVKQENLIPAQVLGSMGSLFKPTKLIIDKGEKDGIKKGMSVVVEKNLVGVIDEALPSLSRVKLAVDKNFSTLVKAQNSSAIGIIKGEDEFMLFDNVVITDRLDKGDLVLTKGDINSQALGIYPNLIVGKISSINKNDSKPFQTAKVDSLINYSRISNVFIISY